MQRNYTESSQTAAHTTSCKMQTSAVSATACYLTAPLLFIYLKISQIFRSQGPKQCQGREQTKYTP